MDCYTSPGKKPRYGHADGIGWSCQRRLARSTVMLCTVGMAVHISHKQLWDLAMRDVHQQPAQLLLVE